MAETDYPEVYRRVLDSLQTGVYMVDPDRRIVYWNDGAERVTGFLRHEVVGRHCRDSILSHCDEDGCVMCGEHCPLRETMSDGRPREARISLQHKAGHRVRVHIWASPIRDERGNIIGAVESFEETLSSPSSDRRTRDLSAHGCTDEKTGLSNHSFTDFQLRENLAAFEQYRLPFSILIVEIKRLPEFAAKYSREAVDAILRSVAESLRNSVRPVDTVGRWRDDRFAIILPSCGALDAAHVATRICQIAKQTTIHWWGDPLSVTVACGAAVAAKGDSVESLVQRAETTLAPLGSTAPEQPLAKRHGQGQV